MKRDNAFTGLEAAIVLIAFVVVAAVFSYVMLGAGFFATQKAQEVTYAGIKQATSNVVFEGMMYGQTTVNTDTNIANLTGFTFSVKVPGGGMAIDMSNTEFVYTSVNIIPPMVVQPGAVAGGDSAYIILAPGVELEYPDYEASGEPTFYGYFPADNGVANTILQPGQSATYTVMMGEELQSGDWFSLEMIPQIGAPTLITKRLDAGLKDGRPLL